MNTDHKDQGNAFEQEGPRHGGRRREAALEYGMPREELMDFSASINPLGPPSGAVNAVRTAAAEMGHYPEEEPVALRTAVSEHLGVGYAEVVLGNGSSEIIYWLAAELAPRRVLIVEPTFSEYGRACRAAGAHCDSLLLAEGESFALDVERLEPAGYDLVFVCNPNNPSGYFAPLEDMLRLWQRCRAAGTRLAVDEAFIDFTAPGQSLLAAGLTPGLFIIRSFTKSHALAGLRLGCLAAHSDFAARLRTRIPPWNINAFAQVAGLEALLDGSYLDRTRSRLEQARSSLFMGLMAMPGLEPLPSAANFILCRLERISSAELCDRLARTGILVRDCSSFMELGNRYIREIGRAHV